MIKEVKKYTDDEGRSVTAYIPLETTGMKDFEIAELVAYEGQVGIQTPMGVAPIRFPFPENYTLEQCYENFEDIATVEVDKVMEEAKEKAEEAEKLAQDKNLIITPGQMNQQINQQGQTLQFPQG
jgi:hypothetical protein